MRFGLWKIATKKPEPRTGCRSGRWLRNNWDKRNPTNRREIFLWDFGGQPEYQLIHQAFLHDTTLALFLFDPTRGEQDFADVEKWNRRLEAQLRGKKAVKILVRSKLDQKPDFVVDPARIDLLKREHGFDCYLEVSAKQPELGFAELRLELARRIDWEQIAIRCRLRLWQSVYELIAKGSRRRHSVAFRSGPEARTRRARLE